MNNGNRIYSNWKATGSQMSNSVKRNFEKSNNANFSKTVLEVRIYKSMYIYIYFMVNIILSKNRELRIIFFCTFASRWSTHFKQKNSSRIIRYELFDLFRHFYMKNVVPEVVKARKIENIAKRNICDIVYKWNRKYIVCWFNYLNLLYFW